jgi:hypothetical protein
LQWETKNSCWVGKNSLKVIQPLNNYTCVLGKANPPAKKEFEKQTPSAEKGIKGFEC